MSRSIVAATIATIRTTHKPYREPGPLPDPVANPRVAQGQGCQHQVRSVGDDVDLKLTPDIPTMDWSRPWLTPSTQPPPSTSRWGPPPWTDWTTATIATIATTERPDNTCPPPSGKPSSEPGQLPDPVNYDVVQGQGHQDQVGIDDSIMNVDWLMPDNPSMNLGTMMGPRDHRPPMQVGQAPTCGLCRQCHECNQRWPAWDTCGQCRGCTGARTRHVVCVPYTPSSHTFFSINYR